MLGHLYAALRSANLSDDQARAAAEEVAGFDTRISKIEARLLLLQWMVGTLLALQIGLGFGNLWLSFDILSRLPR